MTKSGFLLVSVLTLTACAKKPDEPQSPMEPAAQMPFAVTDTFVGQLHFYDSDDLARQKDTLLTDTFIYAIRSDELSVRNRFLQEPTSLGIAGHSHSIKTDIVLKNVDTAAYRQGNLRTVAGNGQIFLLRGDSLLTERWFHSGLSGNAWAKFAGRRL